MRIDDKIALVTGASRGIGASIAKALAKEGAEVLVNYRASGDEAKAVVGEIVDAGGRASLAAADVSNPAELDLMFAMIKEKFGRLDVLVNNAGVADRKIWNAKLDEITPDMWSKVFAVDVVGGFMCTQKSVPLLSRGGSIVNISSTPVLVGDTQGLVYACGKAAVLAETKSLARILAPNIRVNCMILGSIETSWVDWLDQGTIASYTSSIPLGRFGRTDEVASVAVFFASDASSYITGQSIVVDGGDVMD
jgi:3-oxoacyl-[acyl-carrier protein] reductase